MKKLVLFLIGMFVGMFALIPIANAGVMEIIKTVVSSGSLWAGLGALVLVYVFKAIPNQKIYDFVFAFFNRLGVVMTLGLTKWKWSAPLWQSTVEVWFIDLVDNTVGAAVNGFIMGLKSDNPNN